MPDRNKEAIEQVLSGEVKESTSSDSYIERDVAEREREYYAVTGRVITGRFVSSSESGSVSKESPAPVTSQLSASKLVDGDESVVQEVSTPKVIGLPTLTPAHSAVGASIRAEKLKKLRKAA